MAEYSDALAIIQRYDGSKAAFEDIKGNYLGKVVFIAGSTATGATITDKKQYIWVSGEGEAASEGRYIDFDLLDRFKTIKVNSTSVSAEGATTITLSNGTGITLTYSNGTITFALNDEYKNKINDTADKATNNATDIATLKTAVGNINTTLDDVATKTELNNAVSRLISDGSDTSADNTIKGAKAYADSVAAEKAETAKSELLGTTNDTLDDKTIRGNANVIQQISDAFPVTLTNNNDGTYTLKQGTSTVGTITIPKDMVVTSGSVVAGTWSDTTFTESTSGTGKAIKLTIANQTAPIYINVKDLVDVYTAKAGATEIQLAISATNEISAAIVAVNGSKITDGTVTKAKLATAVQTSLGKADTAYQKPSTGIPKTDLASAVQTSLGKADNAIQSVKSTATPYISATTDTSKKEVTITATTTPLAEVEGNTLLGAQNGLATAEDVFAYLKARLSVKVIS